MKYAADFRYIAREALRGKWLIALVVGLVASLLGGAGADGPEVKLNIDASGANASFEYAGQTIFSTGGGLNSEIGAFLVGSAIYITIAAIAMAVVYFILGSIIETGYARFNLKLVDRQDASFESLFAYFTHWKTMAVARLLRSIYVLLWSLLLVIPGIIASYSYAMTSFLLAERPELEAGETITLSKELMSGNRWRLFCLHFSFIGWLLLSALTFGILLLWIIPYMQTAQAAFYESLKNDQAPRDYFGEN